MQPENSPPSTTNVHENFALVPSEVQGAILLCMSLDELFQCMLVCRHWHELCSNNRLWLALCARDFPEWAWCGPKEEGEDEECVALLIPHVEAVVEIEPAKYPLPEHAHHQPDFHHRHAKSIYVRSLQVRRYLMQHMTEQLRPRESQCGSGKNQQDHILGHCMRGEIEEVFFNCNRVDFSSYTQVRTCLSRSSVNKNSLMEYRLWMYYGNYSSPYTGVIKRATLNGDDVRNFVQHREGKIIQRAFKFLPRIALPIACREYYVVSGQQLYSPGSSEEELMPFRGSLLHWAAVSGNLAMVKFLVEEGVDLTLRIPAYDATAKDIARANGNEKIYYYLNEVESLI